MLSQPIVRVLFQHGNFVAESTRLTAWALIFYALALPAISIAKLIVQAFYATKDTKTPVWIAAAVLVLNIALNSMFLFLFFPQLRNAGPALATAVSAYVNFVSLFVIFRRRYGRIGARAILFSVVKASVASALMAGVCWFAVRYGNLGHRSLSEDAAMLLATITGSVVVYLGLSWLLRAPEIREVYEFILWRKGTGATAGLA